MLFATILILIAAGLCAMIYLRGGTSENISGCGTANPYKTDHENVTGHSLFNQNCASCHHPLKDITGPALQGLDKRFPMDLLYEYIQYPQKAVKKNKYLSDLEKKYDMKHIAFPSLSKAEIDSIVDYSNSFRFLSVP
jgi:mono/diheme cytochrome c family protein